MEIEIKLNVQPEVAGGPVAFFARLAAVDRLGPFALGPAVEHAIRDVYFDTADRRLGAARVALRLREQDGVRLVTLKAPQRREGALAVREEREAVLRAASLAQVVAALAELRLLAADTVVDPAAFGAGTAAGPLRPVLATRTRRIERAVGRDAVPIAMLALDTVQYEGLPTVYYDVEAEATAAGSEADLLALQALLTQTAGDALTPGLESKLARGLRLTGLA